MCLTTRVAKHHIAMRSLGLSWNFLQTAVQIGSSFDKHLVWSSEFWAPDSSIIAKAWQLRVSTSHARQLDASTCIVHENINESTGLLTAVSLEIVLDNVNASSVKHWPEVWHQNHGYHHEFLPYHRLNKCHISQISFLSFQPCHVQSISPIPPVSLDQPTSWSGLLGTTHHKTEASCHARPSLRQAVQQGSTI